MYTLFIVCMPLLPKIHPGFGILKEKSAKGNERYLWRNRLTVASGTASTMFEWKCFLSSKVAGYFGPATQ
jgi:hypothetical protein